MVFLDLTPSIPEGECEAMVQLVEESVSRTGKNMLIWDFQLADGQVLKVYTLLPPHHDDRLRQILEVLLARHISSSVEFDPTQLIGKRLILQVIHRKSKDTHTEQPFTRVDVKSFKPLQQEDPLEE